MATSCMTSVSSPPSNKPPWTLPPRRRATLVHGSRLVKKLEISRNRDQWNTFHKFPVLGRLYAESPTPEPPQAETDAVEIIGEDAAAFDLKSQSILSWSVFSALLTGALGALYLVWISPSTGYGDEFVDLLRGWTQRPDVTMVAILTIFAISHSGLAGLRPYGEKIIGARAYRVIFALVSLPLATTAVVFFINHRYEGSQLWMLQNEMWIKPLVWTTSFVSFFFLYPSTFNLLEAVGQAMWCLAHTLWIGNSFMVVTSLGLMAHHAFGCWHGDRRLAAKHGKAFEAVKDRTSVLPFQAIIEGRQKLPSDYYTEFFRLPYLFITLFTLGAYFVHPLMFRGSLQLGW